MSLSKQLNSTEISPRTAIFSITALVVVSAGVIVGIVKFTGGSTPGETVKPNRPSITHLSQPTENNEGSTGYEADMDGARAYDVIVSRNLFRPVPGKSITVVPSAASGATTDTPKAIDSGKPAAPPAPPQNGRPHRERPHIACTGIVNIGGDTYALIENLDQDRAQYTRLDGMAFGYRVIEITPRAVTLEGNGETMTLRVGENKSDTVATPPPANTETPAATPPPEVKPGEGGPPPGIMPPGFIPGSGPNGQWAPRGRSMREG